ncbi:MAG: cell division protein ZapA [Nitrospirota bacterium]|nr:cell division protein ZapA [Nitrospirota bacterium]MDE3036714.1 cell division protein ZapA [Nitrospirota bacterium]MDE3224500.1 cell division protein ZapA [Nitrospirota bacterium]MDE3242027.1 cell division protein ZapA [Nitrospirota bacterium]
MAKTLEIEIYGQKYTVKADADERYMQRVAAYVDEQMRTLARGMKTATPSKLAVLVALNVAHQLFQAEAERDEGVADVERRAQHLMESIEETLQSGRQG